MGTDSKFLKITADLAKNLTANGVNIVALSSTLASYKQKVDKNTADIAQEVLDRKAGDLGLSNSLSGAGVSIAKNAADILANSNRDTTFRSFDWKKVTQGIYDMIHASTAVQMVQYKLAIEKMINAPFTSP